MGGRGRAGAASLEKVARDARALLGAKRAGAGTGPRHLSALKFVGARRRRAARVCGADGQRGGRAAALLRLSAGRRAERAEHRPGAAEVPPSGAPRPPPPLRAGLSPLRAPAAAAWSAGRAAGGARLAGAGARISAVRRPGAAKLRAATASPHFGATSPRLPASGAAAPAYPSSGPPPRGPSAAAAPPPSAALPAPPPPRSARRGGRASTTCPAGGPRSARPRGRRQRGCATALPQEQPYFSVFSASVSEHRHGEDRLWFCRPKAKTGGLTAESRRSGAGLRGQGQSSGPAGRRPQDSGCLQAAGLSAGRRRDVPPVPRERCFCCCFAMTAVPVPRPGGQESSASVPVQ